MPIVVTGVGVAAPNGLGTPQYWRSVLAGASGIRRITAFGPELYPAVLAGQVPGFDAAARLPSRLLPQTDRMTQLALVAADEALADAALDPAAMPRYAVGVVTASSAGGFEFGQRELQALWDQGSQYVSAYQSFAWFYAVNTGQISIRHGLRGPSGVLVSEQAGGLDAIGQACRQLRDGVRAVVTGGVDGSLCPWGWTAHLAGGQLSVRTDPARAFLPFDADANGQVIGEGGALLLLEDAGSAAARGVLPYGEVTGYAATFDGGPRPVPDPAAGLRRAIELAMDRGRHHREDIDLVLADGAGIAGLDQAEAAAISAVFGPFGVPVSVPKTMTGRLLAGGAALDVATALLALRDGVIPPSINIERPAAGMDLDLVLGAARAKSLRTVLVLARGRGGFNSALVVRRAAAAERST